MCSTWPRCLPRSVRTFMMVSGNRGTGYLNKAIEMLYVLPDCIMGPRVPYEEVMKWAHHTNRPMGTQPVATFLLM